MTKTVYYAGLGYVEVPTGVKDRIELIKRVATESHAIPVGKDERMAWICDAILDLYQKMEAANASD